MARPNKKVKNVTVCLEKEPVTKLYFNGDQSYVSIDGKELPVTFIGVDVGPNASELLTVKIHMRHVDMVVVDDHPYMVTKEDL